MPDNNKAEETRGRGKTELDGMSVESSLNSDNAFSDKGLENETSARKAMKKGNQT